VAKETIGQSQDFVLGQGLRQVVINSSSPYWALVDAKGNLRVFAELTADPDRPDVRPREAYHALLSPMFPGWTVRVLQLFWPDPVPRQAFQCQVETCRVGAAHQVGAARRVGAVQKMNGENTPVPPWPGHQPVLADRPGDRQAQVMNEGLALLREGLLLFVQSAPLPFARRTILDFVLSGQNESLAWWEGMSGTLREFGLRVRPLSAEEILELARWVFNPNLEG